VTCAAELSGCDYSAEAEIRRAEGEGEMKGPKPVGRRWTPVEEDQLQTMLDARMTAIEIATKLKRTRQAIYARLQHL
jgi:hypothetical protein